MKADLTGQIHELMELGVRPATMTDIKSRAPVRMTVLQRATVRSRLAGSRLIVAPGGSPASRFGRAIGLGDRPHWPSRAIMAGIAALVIIATVIGVTLLGSPSRRLTRVLSGSWPRSPTSPRASPHPRSGTASTCTWRPRPPSLPLGSNH